MHGWYILDDTNTPVPAETLEATGWMRRFPDRKRVDRTVRGDVTVSTVFLGLDHGWEGVPLLWETMVFRAGQASEMDRYSTYDEAVAGHAAMVEMVWAAPADVVEEGKA